MCIVRLSATSGMRGMDAIAELMRFDVSRLAARATLMNANCAATSFGVLPALAIASISFGIALETCVWLVIAKDRRHDRIRRGNSRVLFFSLPRDYVRTLSALELTS